MSQFDALGSEAVQMLLSVNAAAHVSKHRFLSRLGLTLPQYELLRVVFSEGPMSLGRVADLIHCTRGNITGVVDRLEAHGWLVRDRNPEDRRVVHLRLTKKGETFPEVERIYRKELASIVQVWTPQEQAEVFHALLKVRASLEAS